MDGRVVLDMPLQLLTTYRLGGPAALFVEPAGPGDVATLVGVLKRSGATADAALFLLMGRGSNLVVSDRGWPGVVLRMGPAFSYIKPVDSEGADANLVAGASTSLPVLANWAARRSL